MTRIAAAHLLHGFLGAGKSTLARRLAAEHDAVVFNSDAWMVALFGADPPAGSFGRHEPTIKAQLQPQWARLLGLGVDVVLDYGFWSRAERDAARTAVSMAGGVPRLYALHADRAEARARIARRNEEPGALFIAPETYDALLPRFEPLAPDEVATPIR